MWNDTDTPLAYFISFRGHGTWLHGDGRGSTDRHNNIYGTPHIAPNKNWQNHNRAKLIGEPVKLSAARRRSIEHAIRETCSKRDWSLLAINIRTNHVHTVVATGGKAGELALNAFKANATRQMREDGCWTTIEVRGLIRAVVAVFGTNGASRMRKSTFYTAKAMICRTSTKSPPATAGGTDKTSPPATQVVLTLAPPAFMQSLRDAERFAS